MIISQEPDAIKSAHLLQSRCELIRVALRQCHASVEGPQADKKPPFSLRVSHNSIAHALLDSILRIEVHFQVQSFDTSEQPSLIFSIDCAFDLDYVIEDKTYQPSRDSIAAFKDGNAVFNCWSYAREFVHSITSRMELQPPPLPLLRVVVLKPTQATQAVAVEKP
jgi:hypothetical protein